MKKLILPLLALIILFDAGPIKSQSFTNFTTADGLPSNFVNGVAVDANNQKWFGTEAGVAKFNGTDWTVFTTNDGLIDNYINCIAVDQNNHVWAGTDFGLSVYNGSSWTSFTSANGLVNDVVNYICGDAGGNAWVGTNNGLSKFDGSNFTNFTTAEGLPSNMISYLSRDSKNNIWIGTWLGGLAKWDGNAFSTFNMNNQLLDTNITAIGIDALNNKWVCTLMGISVLDSNDQWKVNYTSADGLFHNYVQDIAIDADGKVWAGIYVDYLFDGALSGFDGSSWTSYTVNEGLVSTQIKRTAIDHDNFLWIATGGGVSRFDTPNAGIDDLGKEVHFLLYPNPTTSTLKLEHRSKSLNVRIFDISGQLLFEKYLGDQYLTVDLSTWPSGTFFVEMQDDNGIMHSRFLHER